MKTASGAPLALRIARRMSRARIRGAGVLTRALGRLGMLDMIAQYDLGRVKFGVPLNRIPWDFVDVANYEAHLIDTFCRAIAPLKNVTLFDCGADIGTFSSLVCSRTDRIARIIAFEPNPDTHEFLRSNLSNLPVLSEVISKAISCFEGRGRLERPRDNLTDHARFLVSGEGPLEVTTIDNMNVRSGDVAIKLDVEGGELEALKGAAGTIAAAHQCVVTVEAHPEVAKRIGHDPVESLQFLESVRPFHFLVAETGEFPSTSAPILRSRQTDIWNVVGWTHDDVDLRIAS
jgi:FkbM family methyltransferase